MNWVSFLIDKNGGEWDGLLWSIKDNHTRSYVIVGYKNGKYRIVIEKQGVVITIFEDSIEKVSDIVTVYYYNSIV